MNKEEFFEKPLRGSTQQPDHIFLSISDDPKTTATVSWRTSTDVADGYMEFYEQGSAEKQKTSAVFKTLKSDIDVSNFFWAKAEGLKPGTKYFYTVGSASCRSDVFSFMTQEENCESYKFLIISDHQNSSPHCAPEYKPVRRMLTKALELHPDCRFIFTVGDNCDNGQNETQWNGMFHGLKGIIESIPYMMSTGNHDNRGYICYLPEPVGKFYLEHADFFDAQFEGSYPSNGPDGYKTENYFFDYGNTRFIILGINAPEKVGDWASEKLRESNAEWKLGAFHFPVYPVMPEGQNDDAYPYFRDAFENARTDVVFSGHEHSLARTFPIKDDCMFDRPSEGTVHYIMGNSGANIYCSNAQKVWHSMFYPQEEPLAMYSIAEVERDRLTVTAYLEDGRVCDRFVIDKGSDTIEPPACAPIYHRTKMAFKGRMLELVARGKAPEMKDGLWFAPFAVLIQAIGGAVSKLPEGIAELEAYGHRAVFRAGSAVAETELGEVVMSAEVYLKDGQLYIPVEDSAKIFGMTWYYSRRNNFIDWEHSSEDKPLSSQP